MLFRLDDLADGPLRNVLEERQARAVRTVAMMRRLGATSKRRRIPKQKYPFVVESLFASALIGRVVGAARVATRPLLEELPRLVAMRAAARARADTTESARVQVLMDAARDQVREATKRENVVGMLLDIANRGSAHQRRELAKQVKAALGIELWITDRAPARLDAIRVDALSDAIEGFVSQNVTLIKSLGAQPLDQVEKVIVRGFADGSRHEDIAAEISRRYEVADSSARLIARDQLAKLTAQVGRERNRDMGIVSWRWRTVGDEAVREEHAVREGNEYPQDYDGLRPGQDVNCRCYEEPVFDNILDELDALEDAA